MGSPVSAADIYSGASLKDGPAIVTSWTGFYIGLGGGGGAVNHDIKVNVGSVQVAELNGIGGEGGLGTVEVGYDRQFGRLVAGVFFNYDFTTISSSISAGGVQINADLDNLWTVGGRVGYLVNPGALAYVLAGYTQANFSLPSFIHGDNPSGFTIGGGLETKLDSHWYLKAEYRFTSFDTETLARFYPVSITSDTDVHTGRVVLSYKGLFDQDIVPLK
jgi:outer membrane immunogenic protein